MISILLNLVCFMNYQILLSEQYSIFTSMTYVFHCWVVCGISVYMSYVYEIGSIHCQFILFIHLSAFYQRGILTFASTIIEQYTSEFLSFI